MLHHLSRLATPAAPLAAFAHAVLVGALLTSASFCYGTSPNIVFIIADDLGWSDVGYNGAEFYETPNIDKLCASGMQFREAYPGAANCMPSRSCIMSGMYVPRTQMWTPGMKAKGDAANMKFLVPRRADSEGDKVFPSLDQLKPSVTSLAEMLKQVGYKTARFGKWHLGTDTQGFHISDSTGRGTGPGGRHHKDVDVEESLTDASIEFIQKNKDAPFFLYLCHWDVHSPIVAREDVAAKHEQRLEQGTWSRDWNPTYAAMIEAVDTSVGRIHRTLQEQGLDKNTLMIFTSDNGGWAPVTWNAPLKAAKGSFYEGGIRVPACMSWPGVIAPGSTCDIPITGVDYMPTFAQVAGAPLPDSQPVDGRSILPLLRGEKALTDRAIFWHYPLYLDGRGYNRVIPVHDTDTMYWRATPCSVIRKGDWKLIEYFEDQSVELFNIRRDIGETHDLSDSNPERTTDLLDELHAWQQATGAEIPATPNPDYRTASNAGLQRGMAP